MIYVSLVDRDMAEDELFAKFQEVKKKRQRLLLFSCVVRNLSRLLSVARLALARANTRVTQLSTKASSQLILCRNAPWLIWIRPSEIEIIRAGFVPQYLPKHHHHSHLRKTEELTTPFELLCKMAQELHSIVAQQPPLRITRICHLSLIQSAMLALTFARIYYFFFPSIRFTKSAENTSNPVCGSRNSRVLSSWLSAISRSGKK
jgi:hypothetical protein